jgi:hypothetical protein
MAYWVIAENWFVAVDVGHGDFLTRGGIARLGILVVLWLIPNGLLLIAIAYLKSGGMSGA